MRRLFALLCTLLLSMMLWTATASHAAEALGCSDVLAGAVEHYEGDGDQVPSDGDKVVPHHHSPCHGHCVGFAAALGDVIQLERSGSIHAPPVRTRSGELATHPALRPPIA